MRDLHWKKPRFPFEGGKDGDQERRSEGPGFRSQISMQSVKGLPPKAHSTHTDLTRISGSEIPRPEIPDNAGEATYLDLANRLYRLYRMRRVMDPVKAALASWSLSPKHLSNLQLATWRLLLSENADPKLQTVFMEALREALEKSQSRQATKQETTIVYRDPRSSRKWYEGVLGKPEHPAAQSAGQRILVAEDDFHIRESLCLRLRGQGYWVVSSADGESALRELQFDSFSLAFLDMKLPGIHGLDLINYLARKPVRIPIIVCTAHAAITQLPEVSTYGPLRICSKPFQGRQIVHFVNELLETAA